MKIEFNYGKRLAVIPMSAYEHIEKASKLDMKVLFCLASSNSDDIDAAKIADMIGHPQDKIERSIAFWQKAGVVEIADIAVDINTIEEKSETKTVIKRSDDIPSYTTEELSEILTKRKEASSLVDECQRIVGKIFNAREINILLGFMDYLDLDTAYITALLTYCTAIGKKSLSYAEKLAISFVESDIDNVDALRAKLAELDAIYKNETVVRSIFGMGKRALTSKEKKCIGLWFDKFSYDEKIVKLAYEITVENTKEASVPYCHAILSRWNEEGYKTLEEIERSIEERRSQKSESEGSFDTDDFFEAALRRSYNKTE